MRRRFLIVLLATAGAFAQQRLQFEVASVKPNQVKTGFISASKKESPTSIVYRNISLRHLILDEAFGLSEYQLRGPVWLSFDWFDIDVRKPVGTTRVQTRLMMQNLLAERFHLLAHFEDKEMSAYVLSAGTDRKKLRAAAEGERTSGCPVGTMDDYARIVEKFLQRPVVNETGVPGMFRMRFIVMAGVNSTNVSPGAAAPPPPSPPPNTSGCPGWEASEIPPVASSADEAVREQMGLTLRQTRNAHAHILVIDHIDKDATPN
jgi:uncharacterized protein (TIGR03435 family)